MSYRVSVTTPVDYFSDVRFYECSCHSFKPPPALGDLDDSTMLAVAAVPGKVLEEWRHVALGTWIAWPHAADAVHAEEMTAAQLRALLAGRNRI